MLHGQVVTRVEEGVCGLWRVFDTYLHGHGHCEEDVETGHGHGCWCFDCGDSLGIWVDGVAELAEERGGYGVGTVLEAFDVVYEFGGECFGFKTAG